MHHFSLDAFETVIETPSGFIQTESSQKKTLFSGTSNSKRIKGIFAGNISSSNEENISEGVLLCNLFEKHQEKCLNHIDSQFAAVIFDQSHNTVTLLIQWPGGLYPLFYYQDKQTLYFATRIELLITRCNIPAQPNEQTLVELLEFGGIFTESTLLKGVCRVLPGIPITFNGEKISRNQAFLPPLQTRHKPTTPHEILDLHLQAIKLFKKKDSKIGAFLSGGLDSSTNVMQLASISDEPIDTFCVSFGPSSFDESYHAEIIAKQFNARHHVLKLDNHSYLDRIPEMIWAMEEPMIDYSFIPTFLIAEFASKHVSTIIGGDGPDHLLGRRYGVAAWCQLRDQIPQGKRLFQLLIQNSSKFHFLRKTFWKHLRKFHAGRQLWLALASAQGAGGFGIQNVFTSMLWSSYSPYEINEILSSDLQLRTLLHHSYQDILPSLSSPPGTSYLYDVCLADASLCGRQGVFAKAGLMCRFHGLTLREPFLSRPMVNFLLQIPDTEKVCGSFKEKLLQNIPSDRTKIALRKALKGLLPDEIVHDKKKQGFEPPLADWLRSFTRGKSTKQLLKSITNNCDWFNEKYLDKIVNDHHTGIKDNQYMLILLIGIDLWYKIYIDGGAQKPMWTWRDYTDQ